MAKLLEEIAASRPDELALADDRRRDHLGRAG